MPHFATRTDSAQHVAKSIKGDVGVGGNVHSFIAGATLNVGEVVFLSAAKTVNKTAVAGNQALAIGVVVGGFRTRFEIIDEFATNAVTAIQTGIQAAQVGEEVLVMVQGIFWVISDAAINVGDPLKVGTNTAGRALTGAVNADSGKIIGIALEAAAGAGLAIKALIARY